MDVSCTYVPYKETGSFSHLVTDYLDGNNTLEPFYQYAPNAQGLKAAIEARSQYPVNRTLLTQILEKQYASLPQEEAVATNIALLKQENCFTICTAHQPNLLTGYLYFIYKIIHAIKLAEDLNKEYSGKHFVPVYYMGSEDNDLEELGTFRYAGKKFVWDGGGQTGAVGRMSTKSLKPVLAELFKLLGPPGADLDWFTQLVTDAYTGHKTIAEATQYLVHGLFGRYGLVIINADEPGFKQSIQHIIKDDLLHHTADGIVSVQIDKLSQQYKSQAHPRAINLFYLGEQLRERIEKDGNNWKVLNTDIVWTEPELLDMLEKHPERFSPNVILRGMLQETILPDVAFIGGGAEVAYWLQLKTLFNHYHVFYPAILLRQSAMWIPPYAAKLRKQLELEIKDVFKPAADLERDYMTGISGKNWQTTDEMAALEQLLAQLKEKATALDITLAASAEAALSRMKRQVQVLEKKMLRAEKRKNQVALDRITRLKENLFPNNSLQERVENASGYLTQYGQAWLDALKDATQPLKSQFVVIEEQD